MMLVMVGIVCGCFGSTASGLKVDRLLILFKSIGRYVNNILHPYSVNEVRLGKHMLKDEDVSPHLLYAALYALVMVVSVFLTICAGIDMENSVAGTVMTLGNVGPATGAMGTMGSFNHMTIAAKVIFSMDMFLGRIEIYPVLAVIGMMMGRNRK